MATEETARMREADERRDEIEQEIGLLARNATYWMKNGQWDAAAGSLARLAIEVARAEVSKHEAREMERISGDLVKTMREFTESLKKHAELFRKATEDSWPVWPTPKSWSESFGYAPAKQTRDEFERRERDEKEAALQAKLKDELADQKRKEEESRYRGRHRTQLVVSREVESVSEKPKGGAYVHFRYADDDVCAYGVNLDDPKYAPEEGDTVTVTVEWWRK